jgi:uncharacterized protein YjbJ (UPF0337 family)
MAQGDTRSLNEIKRETEQSREALLETVELLRSSVLDTTRDIRQRVKPASIKAEMGGYVRSRAQDLLKDAGEAARKNPVQAAALVGGLAYPLLRVARAIPMPVWLVGAGLYLARSETVAHGAAALGEKISDASSKAASTVSDTLGRAAEQVSEAGERAGSGLRSADMTASAGGSLREATGKITDTVSQMSASTSESATGAAEKVASMGRDAIRSAKDSMSKVAETASEAGAEAGKSIFRTVEENPLLVAGVGLFIGGVIASVLPRSELEDEFMGPVSRQTKRRAQSVADRGIGAASDVARAGLRRASEQAEAEGIDPDSLGDAARDVGQRLRRVAEAAVTTAFEPPEESAQENEDGGRDNG